MAARRGRRGAVAALGLVLALGFVLALALRRRRRA